MQIDTLVVGALKTNCYVLSERGQCIVIDAGGDGSKIASHIRERGLWLNYILATHCHFDHIAAVEMLRKKFDSPFHVHRDEAAMLSSASEMAMQFLGISIDHISDPDGFISDDKYIIGETDLKPLHTPGHTEGSVSFLTEGILFSGDTLFRGSIGRTDIGGSLELMRNTIEKIRGFDNDLLVYPGHGQSTTIGEEKRSNPFLLHRDW